MFRFETLGTAGNFAFRPSVGPKTQGLASKRKTRTQAVRHGPGVSAPCLHHLELEKSWQSMELGAQLEQTKQNANCDLLLTLPLICGSDVVINYSQCTCNMIPSPFCAKPPKSTGHPNNPQNPKPSTRKPSALKTPPPRSASTPLGDGAEAHVEVQPFSLAGVVKV